MGLGCIWDMLDVQNVVFEVYNLFGVDLGCLFKLWPVENGEKTSFKQNSRAGRDLCFTGTDLLEFLGFLKNSSLQVATCISQVATYAGFSAFGCRLMSFRYPSALGLTGVGYGGL